MAKVKITVIKKLNSKDLYGENPPATVGEPPECGMLDTGQEFIIDAASVEECPPGLCSWAFADIHRDIMHILYGGDFPWMKDKGVAISCCTDGLKPVIFRIERIAD